MTQDSSSQKAPSKIREMARVITSGFVAYLSVHFVVLPQLMAAGVSFPVYLGIGVAVTGFLSVLFCVALINLSRALEARSGATQGKTGADDLAATEADRQRALHAAE